MHFHNWKLVHTLADDVKLAEQKRKEKKTTTENSSSGATVHLFHDPVIHNKAEKGTAATTKA